MAPLPPLTALQRRIVWLLGLSGALLRLIWIVVVHPPAQHIYSDMAGYIDRARVFFTSQPETIADTVFPPGTYALYGVLYRLDPAWNLAALAQWLMSLGAMGLIWLIARRLYGNTAALIALALATFYLPFVHYASLFLAENPFTLTTLLTVWLSLRAIDAERPWPQFFTAVLAGAALGCAASFKNTIFLPFVLTGLFYLLFAQLRGRRWLPLAIGTLIGASLLFAPMTQRCTRLSDGHFCLSANNIALNMLMGHYGRNGPYHWHDEPRHLDFEFQSPSTSQRGYTQKIQLPFGAYDNAENLKATLGWVRAHPALALRLSLDNEVDLFFSPSLWPPFRLLSLDLGALSQRLFWLAVLAPATLYLATRIRSMLRLTPSTLPEWLLLLPVLGLMATVFLSIGETRHRVPFDGLLIVLAAAGYTRLLHYFQSRKKGSSQRPAG